MADVSFSMPMESSANLSDPFDPRNSTSSPVSLNSELTASPTTVSFFPVVNTDACNIRDLLRHLTYRTVFGLSDYLWGYIRLEVPVFEFLATVVSLFREFALAADDDPHGPGGAYLLRLASRVHYWVWRCWRADPDLTIADDLRAFIIEDLQPRFAELGYHCLLDLDDAIAQPPEHHSNTLFVLHSEMPELQPAAHHDFKWQDPYLMDLATSGGLKEFARQLTLVMSRAFREIEPWDLIRAWHDNTGRRDLVLPDRAYCDLSAGLGRWVTRSICDAWDSKALLNIHQFWRDVAEECFKLRNLEATAMIASCLNSTVVHTRRQLAIDNTSSLLSVIKNLFFRFTPRPPPVPSPADAIFWSKMPSLWSAPYQALLGGDTMPTVPCLGLHKMNIIALASSNEDVAVFEKIDGSLLFSVSALEMMANHTYELERMHKPYPFTENRHMQRWIQDMLSRGA